MNYKDTLFFIGKCLTISHEMKNKKIVEQILKSNAVNWDLVVKTSTKHYVFPAMYMQLKMADFLIYIPKDLVAFMDHITELNRKRNRKIIKQAKEINNLLLSHHITPIFLKGTGNLLEGLYNDIAERMVGDIDFIVSEDQFQTVVNILLKNGYASVMNYKNPFPSFKHYPRLRKEKRIAAVEIHKQLLNKQYADEFNFSFIKKDAQYINGVTVLSYKNQLSLSIIAKQINDNGFQFKNIALRNAYDVFLLSKKVNTKSAFDEFNKLVNPLTCFLAICHSVFGQIASLEYVKTKQTIAYTKLFEQLIANKHFRRKHFLKTKRKVIITKRLSIIFQSFFDKKQRNWLISLVTNKEWQQKKLIQLGLPIKSTL